MSAPQPLQTDALRTENTTISGGRSALVVAIMFAPPLSMAAHRDAHDVHSASANFCRHFGLKRGSWDMTMSFCSQSSHGRRVSAFRTAFRYPCVAFVEGTR